MINKPVPFEQPYSGEGAEEEEKAEERINKGFWKKISLRSGV
jgi:hypothetical protein